MAEQKASDIYKMIRPLINADNERTFRRITQQINRVTNTVTNNNNGGGSADSAALNNHIALEYDEAHGTSAANARVHHSIHYGIVGGSTIDETANLSAMIDEVGIAGGGKIIVRAATNGDSIRLDDLAGIYHSDIDIEFQSPISAGAGGGVRAMGAMDEYVRAPATFAGGLSIDASVGDTTVTLSGTAGKMQASDYLPGDLVTLRGENNAAGEALTKQIVTILSVNAGANTITFAEELEYDFLAIYPSSAYSATDATTIFLNRTWALTADLVRGAMTATVTDSTGMAVGDMVRVSDSRVEIDLNPAAIRSGGAGPYENECRLEYRIITTIDTGTHTVTFDKPISKGYLEGSPYFGNLAKVLPVENVHIRGINLTYHEPQTDRNIHAISLNFAKDSTIEDCKVNGIDGGMGQQYRISDSFNCWVYRSIGRDPMFHDSAEGYIFANYKSDSSGFRHCQASGGRHNFLMQACTNFTVDSCQSYDGWINGIDTHGVDEWDGLITNCQMSQMNQHAPAVTTSMCGRNGNTSHTPGSHWVVWQNCVFYGNWETNSYGLDILAASTHITVDGCKFFGGDYGIRNSKNPSQCTPTQTAEYITISNCKFENIAVKPIYLEGIPDTAGGTRSSGKLNQILLKNNEDWNCTQHIDVSGGDAITNLTIENHTVVFPVTSPANNYYGLDLSDVDGLMVRNNNFHLCSRGISLTDATNAAIIGNTLTATIDATPITLAGVNTGPGGGALIYVANIVDNTSVTSSGIAATIVDVKGDLIAATAADTVARLAAGANDTILVADNTQTTGLRWATPAQLNTIVGAGALTFTNVDLAVGYTATSGLPTINLGNATRYWSTRVDGTTGEFVIKDVSGAVDRLALDLAGLLTYNGSGFFDGSGDTMIATNSTSASGLPNFQLGNATRYWSIRIDGTSGKLIIKDISAALDRMIINLSGHVGIGVDPVATLDVARGSGAQGTAKFSGTAVNSHFNFSTDEHTYIRGGKATSDVVIGDSGSGDVTMGQAGAGLVSAVGNMTVGGTLTTTGPVTDGNGGYRQHFSFSGLSTGVVVDILPNDGDRAAGVVVFGILKHSVVTGACSRLTAGFYSGLPYNEIMNGTDTFRMTCSSGGKVSMTHYAGSSGTFSGSFDVYWSA